MFIEETRTPPHLYFCKFYLNIHILLIYLKKITKARKNKILKDIFLAFLHTKKEHILFLNEGGINMNKFTTGLLTGSAMVAMGAGYLMRDRYAYQKMKRKGKNMVRKTENVVDGVVDDFMN